MRRIFRLPTITPYTLVRVDEHPDVDSPADIRTSEGELVIAGSQLRAGGDGDLPDVLGPEDPAVESLYLKVRSANVGLALVQSEVPDLEVDPSLSASLSGAAGSGLVFDGGQLAIALSSDPGNTVGYGSDEGLYVPPGTTYAAPTPGGAYRHDQATAATVWTVTHALGYDPAGVAVIAEDGYLLDDYGVQYLIPGESLRLSFDITVAGTVYLS